MYGCGYNPINQISDKQVSITKYSLNGNSEINRYLKLNFDRFKKTVNTTRNLEVIGSSKITKSITSKNSSGEATGYEMQIEISIIVNENGKELISNIYKKDTSYSNLASKFELKQYEKILIKDLVKDIILEINNNLAMI